MSGPMSSGAVAPDRAFQRILGSIKQLPSPSEVCLAVTRATDAQHTTLSQLQSLVESDIALSGRLMQVANSSFFGVREQVASVRRAIALLGFATVRTLALGFFFNEEFGKLCLPGLPYPDLPRFALSSSVLAEAIAGAVDASRAAEAACLGLLHESGVIIMAMTFGSHYRQMLRLGTSSSAELAALEQRTFGLNHPLAGQLLFESWRLGPELAAAVAHHHRLDGDADLPPTYVLLWKILLLANSLALPLLNGWRPAAAQKPSPAANAAGAPEAATQPAVQTGGQDAAASPTPDAGQDDSPAVQAQNACEKTNLAQRLFGWPAAKLAQVMHLSRQMYRQRLAILGQQHDEPDAAGACDPSGTAGRFQLMDCPPGEDKPTGCKP